MPTYTSQCPICNSQYEFFRKLDQYDDTPVCCDQKTTKTILKAPMWFFKGGSQFNAYECPVTGDVVTNPKQKHEIEVSNDLIIKEKGMARKEKMRGYVDDTPEMPDELKPELQKELAMVNSQ